MSSPTPPQPEPPSAANGPAPHDVTHTAALTQGHRRRKPGKAGKFKPAPDMPRSNWVSVRRDATDDETFIEQYVLDPTLEDAWEPLSNTTSGGIGEERPSLEVRTAGSDVDIDVWISASYSGPRSTEEIVRIHLEGKNVTLRLHSVARRTVHVIIDAAELSIDLPPDFKGVFHTNTRRSRTHFSRDLLRKLVVNDEGPQGMTGVIGPRGNAQNLSYASVLTLRSSESYISLRSLREGWSLQKSLSKLFKRMRTL